MPIKTPRPKTCLAAECILNFNIPELLVRIKGEKTWQIQDRNAMILCELGGLRSALVAMRKGAVTAAHLAAGPVQLYVIEGSLIVHTESDPVALRKGEFLALDAGVRHEIEAAQESAFLLTAAAERRHPAEIRTR